jgi:hypothetical protein
MTERVGHDVLTFRVRDLRVRSPALLASTGQGLQVARLVQLPDFCGEAGVGGRHWLITLDQRHKQVTFGAAPASEDPFGLGYCYLGPELSGFDVRPATAKAKRVDHDSWQVAPMAQINLASFLDGDVNKVSVLPFRNLRMSFDLSERGACIGAYNGDAGGVQAPNAEGLCLSVPGCERWKSAGSLAAALDLAAADAVPVPSTGRSLCMLLTGNAAPAEDGVHCARTPSGEVVARGDYCAKSDTPATATCADSFWVTATFAASAVNIHDGDGVPLCAGEASEEPAPVCQGPRWAEPKSGPYHPAPRSAGPGHRRTPPKPRR